MCFLGFLFSRLVLIIAPCVSWDFVSVFVSFQGHGHGLGIRGHLEPSWRPMGPSWAASEATLESCWAFLAPSWVMFGHSSATCGAGGRSLNNSHFKATAVDLKSVAIFSHLRVSWGPHGALLKPSWSLVSFLGAILDFVWPSLAPGTLAGAPWAILFQATAVDLKSVAILNHPGVSWGPHGALLKPSWSLVWLSWRHLGPSLPLLRPSAGLAGAP